MHAVDRCATSVEVRARVDVPITLDGRNHRAVVCSFSGLADEREHVALALGPYERPLAGAPLVRLHSECLTGDLFGSRRCDCGPQLTESIGLVARAGGYVVYLRQEGRGIGLYAKLDAYLLQDAGLDTFSANRALGFAEDLREYAVAAQMLLALGADRVDLLTGNEDKAAALRAGGVTVRRTWPLRRHLTAENAGYLAAKEAAGHRFGR